MTIFKCIGKVHSTTCQARHNWTGLLVEPYPNQLLYKQRRAWVAPTCLATRPSPHYAHFDNKAAPGAMPGLVTQVRRQYLK